LIPGVQMPARLGLHWMHSVWQASEPSVPLGTMRIDHVRDLTWAIENTIVSFLTLNPDVAEWCSANVRAWSTDLIAVRVHRHQTHSEYCFALHSITADERVAARLRFSDAVSD